MPEYFMTMVAKKCYEAYDKQHVDFEKLSRADRFIWYEVAMAAMKEYLNHVEDVKMTLDGDNLIIEEVSA